MAIDEKDVSEKKEISEEKQ